MIRLVCAVLRKTVTSGMRSSSQVIVRHQPLWQWPHRGYYFPHALSKSSPWQSRSKQRYYWARHQATDNRQYHIYGQEWKYIHVQHQRASERCILTNDWRWARRKSLNTTTCVVRENVISSRWIMISDGAICHARSLTRTLCSRYLWLCARTFIPLSCTKSERSSATSSPNIGWRNSSTASSLFQPNGWGQQGRMCSDYLLTDHTTD